MQADSWKFEVQLHTVVCGMNTALVGQPSLLNFLLEVRLLVWHLKEILVLLFPRVKYFRCIMDKCVITDVSYVCQVLWSSGAFFFLKRVY